MKFITPLKLLSSNNGKNSLSCLTGLLLIFFLFAGEISFAQVNGGCTYNDHTNIGDPTCAPNGTNVGKYDDNLGFGDGETRILYIKVCGLNSPPCCGVIDLWTKEGQDCESGQIAGPKGPDLSFAEIGDVTGCSVVPSNDCSGGPSEVDINCSRIKFLGWEPDADEPNCSYFYYEAKSKFINEMGCSDISHVTFDIVDETDCCTIDCPLDVSIECDDSTHPDNTGYPTLTGSCDDADYEDETTPGNCAGNYTITRTWTSGNLTCDQTITVTDTEAPVPPAPPADVNVQCATDVPPPVDLTATDNCADDITVSPTAVITPGNCDNQFVMVRTWTFDDGCGNSSSVSQTITVDDTTPPDAPAPPADLNVQCASDVPAPVNLTANDNCDGDITVSPSAVITPGNCDNQFVMVRTWTFVDDCGNSSSVSQTITVDDTTPPDAPAPPADVNVQCASDVPAPVNLTANDNCDGDITVSPSAVITPGNCDNQFVMVRTWTFTDDCGNSSSVSQTITVDDTTPPDAPAPPADLNVQCASDVPAPVNLTANDNCDGDITVSPSAVITPGNCDNQFVMVRTWTFTDDCGNSSSVSQTITVNDNTAPVAPDAQNVPDDVTVQCVDDIPTPVDLTAQDNCDGPITVSPEDDNVPSDNCNRTVVRTWTFTDDCGNSSNVSQTITVNDNTAPVAPDAQDVPDDVTVQCVDDIPTPVDLTAQDNCDGPITVSPEDDNVPSDNCNRTVVRTWTFTDDCGNSSNVSQTITVNDNTAPVAPDAQDVPDDVTVQCVDDIPTPVDLTAQDNCDGPITVSPEDDNVPSDNCNRTVVRTWTFTDDCGNSSSVSQTITVNDNTAPVAPDAQDVPDDVTVQCVDDIPTPVDLTAQDNCDGPITVSPEDDNVPSDNCNRTVVRTWTFVDECGNQSSVSQTITVDDTTPPDAPAPPADLNVQCASDVPAPVNLTANDNCDGDITVSPSAVITPGNCDNQFVMVRTWTFVDDCGNSSSVSQTITVDDTTPPDAPAPPADVNVQCASDVPAPVNLTANDNCDGDITVSPSAVITPGNCDNQFVMVRTWTFVDDCGNSSSVSQTITVDDTTPPDAPAPPADVNVQCASDVPAPVNLTANDNCDGDITVSPSAVITPGNCDNQFVMVRTWTFTDVCGNSSSVSQTITVNDNTAPVAPDAQNVPDDVTVQCVDDIPTPVDLTAQDNCDGPITVSPEDDNVPSDNCNRTVVRTWTFTDDCGNSSNVSQTITVNDNTAPVAPDAQDVPDDVTVQCVDDIPTPVDLTAQDNCDGPITVSPEDDNVPSDNCNRTVVRTWTFTDDCGNSSSVSQTITVNDNTAPVAPDAQDVPDDVTVQCVDDIPTPVDLTAQDNCDGPITVSPEDDNVPSDNCNRTVVRTWTFVDECGNQSSVSQTITVDDTTPPDAPAPPADVNVQCASDVPAPVNLTANDNCDGDITVSPSAVITPGNCDNQFVMVRTWTFTDDCGNSSSISQTITVDDTTPPDAPAPPADLNVQCASDVPAPVNLTANDNCDGDITVSPSAVITPGNCDNQFVMVRTWTFVDDCGNSSSVSQTITVDDTTPPDAPAPPADVNVQCASDVPAPVNLTANDNCDGDITVSPSAVITPGNCDNQFVMVRTWTFTDVCGNSSSVSQTITVNDNTAPVFTYCPADKTSDCNNLNFDTPTATDNCGTVTVEQFGDDVDNRDDCGDGGNGTVTRTWRATDACGNTADCSQTITIEGCVECETAWARDGVDPDVSDSYCFNDPYVGCNNANQLPWGFTTPIVQGESYSFELLAGAPGYCGNGGLGTDVGDITVDWTTGDDAPTITIDIDDGEGFTMTEAHVWLGCSPLPLFGNPNNPKCKAAPGQLGCSYDYDNATYDQFVCDGEGLPCDEDEQTWIAIHVVTCGIIFCEDDEEEEEGGIVEDTNPNLPAVPHTTLSEVKKLDVRPNPAKDQIELLFETELEEKAIIRIFDLNGKLVKSEIYQTYKGQNSKLIGIDELSEGLYWISVQFESKVMNARFVVSGK